MMRRSLLQLLSLFPAARGDGLVPPLNAPPGVPVPVGVQPGTSSGVVFANELIAAGPNGGVLVYSSKPAKGDLVASVAGQGFLDRFGNQVFPGVAAYDPISFFVNMNASVLSLGSLNPLTQITARGQVSITDAIATTDSPSLVINAPGTVSGDASFMTLFAQSEDASQPGNTYINTNELIVDGFSNVPAFVSAVHPGGGGAPERFQPMSLLNSWAVQLGSYAHYKLLATNKVLVQAKLAAGTLTDGTTIWTAPSGYVPANTHGQTGVVICETGTGTASVLTPYVNINSSGNLMVEHLPSGLVNCSINFEYALDV